MQLQVLQCCPLECWNLFCQLIVVQKPVWSKIFQSNLLSNKTNYYKALNLTREPTESGMVPLNWLLNNHLANGKWVSGLCSSFFLENLKILQLLYIDKRTNRIWNGSAQLVV